jgi:hypothetical protein
MAASFNGSRVKILVMGGTRFVGKPLVAQLLSEGHALTLFTRGNKPVPTGVEHLCGDRSTPEGLAALQGRSFDVIVDSSGRTLDDSRAVIERTGAPSHRFLYVSSAGVYADSELWPLHEDSPTEAKLAGDGAQLLEFLGRPVAIHRDMGQRRPQVLAEGEPLAVDRAQGLQRCNHFLEGFTEAEHQAALGGDLRREFPGSGQQPQRAVVGGAAAHLPLQPFHGFEVVVEAHRLGIEHGG